ncbi:MAG TPA: type II toxin-antitoxin system HicB family antitoxin [Candidatus Acidoferrum sp.]|nr:type II toxin-antitoxin system HicB family antitoxin [Candidatus Acidoferrum sp.]
MEEKKRGEDDFHWAAPEGGANRGQAGAIAEKRAATSIDDGDEGGVARRVGCDKVLASPQRLRRLSQPHASIEEMSHIVYKVETELESDGRWIAEIADVPGVMAYGATEKEAMASAQALALRVLADRIEQQKEPAETVTVSIEAA